MERCMIVDGSSVIRKVAKRILGSNEMLVVEAETGVQALAMARAQLPDYIIVDEALGDMNSADLIRQLRQLDQNRSLKIILCMIQMDLVLMTRAKRAGADEFLPKPFDRKQLMQQFSALRHAA
ncbi:MAG: response regulator [Ahrensia sp.]|nr:response regulator [Ahrensia sp.]